MIEENNKTLYFYQHFKNINIRPCNNNNKNNNPPSQKCGLVSSKRTTTTTRTPTIKTLLFTNNTSTSTSSIVSSSGPAPLLLILTLLMSTLQSINSSSLSMPTMIGKGSSSSAGTMIDMDPYYYQHSSSSSSSQHPHRHSRTNNKLLFKSISNSGGGDISTNNYNSDIDDNNSNSNNHNNNYYFHSSNSNSDTIDAIISNSISTKDSNTMQVIYSNGVTESTLPECTSNSVCNKIETYDKPWIEKQCKCPNKYQPCSSSVSSTDPYSLYDKTRQYKLCEPVRKLKKCRYFRDVTWTITTKGDNVTNQIVHCQCPKDSVAYMIKRSVYRSKVDSIENIGFKYSFACSPITRSLCQRKEPCRLFSLKRKSNHSVNDANSNILCQCPKGFSCPAHHLDAGVIRGKLYPENNLRTYLGYCIQ